MALLTRGVVWTGTTETWGDWAGNVKFGLRWASYGEIYKSQVWVAVLVNKLAGATARLPLKVYERTAAGRDEVRDHPYAVLLRNPNRRLGAYFLWNWMTSTYNIYGESFLGKVRDAGGRPVQLVPLHPAGMHAEDEKDGRTIWSFRGASITISGIPDEDLLHPRTYNPDSVIRGMSPLEPLRTSLEHEEASRRATTSFWARGARPGVVLTHPSKLSPPAADRLKLSWEAVTSGADNYGRTVVLEEGMKPEVMQLTAEEAQFIQSHKMHTEEACAIYDVPPPVVHILDRATFSNITEQMRSMYRDTMGPRLKAFESVFETQLRASVRPGASDPDFGDEVYSEYLLDEVLRGDFEASSDAIQKAVNSAQLTPNEGRALDNRPPLPGGDDLYINSTMIPLLAAQEITEAAAPTRDEMRALMGRLSRIKALDEIDEAALVEGMNGAGRTVLAHLAAARSAGEEIAEFRSRLQAMCKE